MDGFVDVFYRKVDMIFNMNRFDGWIRWMNGSVRCMYGSDGKMDSIDNSMCGFDGLIRLTSSMDHEIR